MPGRRAGLAAAGLVLAGLVGGCYKEPVAITTYPPTDPPGVPTVAPGTPGPNSVATDCVNGWRAAPEGDAEFGTALYLIERRMEVSGSWTVDEVRYFTGPDVPWSETPTNRVERWYVKASLAVEDFRGRWLMERRSDLDYGVVAVAPYDSTGFVSPDWTGFVGDGQPTTYPGLPGQWSGTPYDFVSGDGYSGQPGLPDQVVGCLK